MTTPLDRTRVVIDPQVHQWTLESGMVDLTSAAAVKLENKYVLCSEASGEGQVIVVTGMANFAWARTSVQDPPSTAEGVQMIDPIFGTNFFVFEPRVNGTKPALPNAHYAQGAWTTAAGATSSDNKTGGGSGLITRDPALLLATLRGVNVALFDIPAGQTLQVLFSLVPDPIANPLPRRYSIGGTVEGTQRVDYASVALCGYKIPKQHYDQLVAGV